jgi:Endonuclease/Exonuclease/phosphatase family
MIKYTLFKEPESKDDSLITQDIVRYVYCKFRNDIRPTNIIERDYPADINNQLPSILVWKVNSEEEEEEYIMGGDNVIEWFENTLNIPNLVNAATNWAEDNPNYRINDDHDNSFNTEEIYEEEYEYHDENNYIQYGEEDYNNIRRTDINSDSDMNDIITFASINLWNNKVQREARFANFCNSMAEIDPDIICIQEITQTLLDKLLQQEWTKDYFKSTHRFTSEEGNSKVKSDGELILSKFPILQKETFPYNNTLTEKTVHIAHIQIPLNYFKKKNVSGEMEYSSFPVITTQLEKLKTYSDIRKQQLYSLFNMVSSIPNVFIVADTNLTDEDTDIINLPEGWIDSYEEHLLNLNEIDMHLENNYENDSQLQQIFAETNTFTYDSDYNVFINGFQRYRFDRLFYKSSTGGSGWRCIDYQLICNDRENVVSNHFGIFATFKVCI